MQSLTASAVCLMLASAFLLYGLTYDTRRLEARVSLQERVSESTRSDIALLKAERAHLARPERIEPFARAMGMQPPSAQQFVGGPTDLSVRPADQSR